MAPVKYQKVLLSVITLALVQMVFSGMAYGGTKIEDGDTKWISIGIGARTSFSAVGKRAPNGTSSSKDFNLDNARIYLNGQIHENVKFEFNTECIFCGGGGSKYRVLDAIAKFEFNSSFNLWAGRMLVPADRAEMSGPFYGNTYDFNKTPFYPADQSGGFGVGGAGVYGRDHGVTFWGGLGPEARFTYAAGIFGGYQGGSNQADNPLLGLRISYNFLNVEKNPGYYTSSPYYGGAGDIFTLAFAVQHQQGATGTAATPGNFTGYSLDALYESVLANDAVVTVEAEFKHFNAYIAPLGGLNMFEGSSWTATALYLLPTEVGVGKFQPYVRYTDISAGNSPDRDELGIGTNYIISGHNARISMVYQYGDIASKGFVNYTPTAAGVNVSSFKIGIQFQY